MPPKKQKVSAPTVAEIVQDPLTTLANTHWGPNRNKQTRFDPAVVSQIYESEIAVLDSSRLKILEFSGYLENYLWHNWNESTSESPEHIFSLLALIQEKTREGMNPWDSLSQDADKVGLFVRVLVGIQLESSGVYSSVKELIRRHGFIRVWFIQTWVSLFQSLEQENIGAIIGRFISLPVWAGLTSNRLKLELKTYPQLKRHWTHIQAQLTANTSAVQENTEEKSTKKRKAQQPQQQAQNQMNTQEAEFMPSLIREFLRELSGITAEGEIDVYLLRYLERCMELLIDLLSQLHTRRFLRTVLDDMHATIVCQRSALVVREEGQLFAQLLTMFRWFMKFEINDQTGRALSRHDVMAEQHDRAQALQRIAFKAYPEKLKALAFASHALINDGPAIREQLEALDDDELSSLCVRLCLLGDSATAGNMFGIDHREFMLDILAEHFGSNVSQLQQINERSVYPDEQLLWNMSVLPSGSSYDGKRPLALPKLNLQFLTFFDYLLRSYELFRLESVYEIRQDLVDSVKRLQPRRGIRGDTLFDGWARMATFTRSLVIDEVSKPNIGERVPAMVKATIEIDISRYTGAIREEWEALREHDVVFLLQIELDPSSPLDGANGEAEDFSKERENMSLGIKPRSTRDFVRDEEDMTFPTRFGVKFVRGCEIFEIRDQDNVVLNDPSRPDERPTGRHGNVRKLRVLLDGAQYYQDMQAGREVYQNINVLVRRKSKENNFKGVLQTVRDLMNHESIGRAVPDWLHDVLLGYGDPSSAHYKKMTPNLEQIGSIDFVDTFLDADHLVEAFPESTVTFRSSGGAELKGAKRPSPPYRLQFQENDDGREHIVVEHYSQLNMGPYPQNQPARNQIRYTSAQVEAIRSSMSHGLTLVVGPPGTGKTDVCVQMISNLYHTHPTQKILVLTHSNAALNDVFEKLTRLEIDQRHMLRLGTGERSLREDTQMDFSKWGRVNYSLVRRQQLLQQVYRLAHSLGVQEDVHDTCETAEYFFSFHILSRIEEFETRTLAGKQGGAAVVSQLFPFHTFFMDAPQPLFHGNSFDEDMEIAQGCVRYIRGIFEELSDYRAFELLRTRTHRGDYLLKKQARIVAMTCTHAAIARERLIELGFKYDNIIMEEAGQVLEVETLIPMLLQDVDKLEGARLKRVVLVGDHNQLPPVVQHMALQQYSKLEQSMFTRLIRLGVPHVLLDMQGRTRPVISNLYNWRYSRLENLPAVERDPEYQAANAGFKYPFQLINVEDFQDRGEFAPTPHYYQNLGEAEYVVACYQYMRLLGYPAHKITILSTYNGQKHLIRDVLAQRCANPLYGLPAAVTTVDRYQGQQNDYVLLSLVRTKAVGHLRDVRRLIVAMSRARLGLYIFARQELFENCFELTPVFNQLVAKPTKLQLISGEHFPATRAVTDEPTSQNHVVDDVTAMGVLVYRMHQQAQQMLSSSAPMVIQEKDEQK